MRFLPTQRRVCGPLITALAVCLGAMSCGGPAEPVDAEIDPDEQPAQEACSPLSAVPGGMEGCFHFAPVQTGLDAARAQAAEIAAQRETQGSLAHAQAACARLRPHTGQGGSCHLDARWRVDAYSQGLVALSGEMTAQLDGNEATFARRSMILGASAAELTLDELAAVPADPQGLRAMIAMRFATARQQRLSELGIVPDSHPIAWDRLHAAVLTDTAPHRLAIRAPEGAAGTPGEGDYEIVLDAAEAEAVLSDEMRRLLQAEDPEAEAGLADGRDPAGPSQP